MAPSPQQSQPSELATPSPPLALESASASPFLPVRPSPRCCATTGIEYDDTPSPNCPHHHHNLSDTFLALAATTHTPDPSGIGVTTFPLSPDALPFSPYSTGRSKSMRWDEISLSDDSDGEFYPSLYLDVARWALTATPTTLASP